MGRINDGVVRENLCTTVSMHRYLYNDLRLYCKKRNMMMRGILDEIAIEFLQRPDVKKIVDEEKRINDKK